MSPHLLAATGCVAMAGAGLTIVVVVHNCLVARQAACARAWTDVMALLSRRHAGATELVECLRPHVAIDPAAVAAHGRALEVGAVQEIASATARLAAEIEAIMARAEAHPLVRSSERFRRVRAELAALAHAIPEATRSYDAAVQELDRVRDTLPGRGVVGAMGSRQREVLAGMVPFTAAVTEPAEATA